MRSEQDPYDVGCVAACSGLLSFIVGTILSVWMVYFTGFIVGMIGAVLGIRDSTVGWHVIMGCILLRCVIVIMKQESFLKARLYRTMAALGLAIGYGAMWMLFTFGNVR